jgi:nucleotide-binding universal stress UspA family protein
MSQSILVPLDGSPLAELALPEALALAKLPDSKVTLLRVIPPIEDVIQDGEIFSVDQQWERSKASALKYLKGVCGGPEWKKVAVQLAVEMGEPADVIVDFAEKHDRPNRALDSRPDRSQPLGLRKRRGKGTAGR